MSDNAQERSVSDQLGANIPYLRRFSRAMTGSQQSGDMFAAAALEALLTDRSMLDGLDVKVGLFKVLFGIWASAGAPVEEGEDGARAKAQRRLASLTNNSREALLLHTVEGFPSMKSLRSSALTRPKLNNWSISPAARWRTVQRVP